MLLLDLRYHEVQTTMMSFQPSLMRGFHTSYALPLGTICVTRDVVSRAGSYSQCLLL